MDVQNIYTNGKLDQTYQFPCETYLKIIIKQSNLREHADLSISLPRRLVRSGRRVVHMSSVTISLFSIKTLTTSAETCRMRL